MSKEAQAEPEAEARPLRSSPHRLLHPLPCSAHRWVNTQTAGFCDDFPRPNEPNHPPSRIITRLLFTALLCLLSLLLLLLLLFTQEPTSRTVRYWDRDYALNHFSPFILSTNASQDPDYNTKTASTLCPCANTAFSWNNYVQFFTISLSGDLQSPVRTSIITNGSEFCTNQVLAFPVRSSTITQVGCPNLLNSVVSNTDERTILGAVSLMDPVLLNSTVKRYFQMNLNRALNDCVYLMAAAQNWNVSTPFTFLRDLYEVWDAMLQQYGSNPHSSDLDFWKIANTTFTTSHQRLIQVIDGKSALGMQVNWTEYVEGCSPIYCDVVKETSLGARFFTGLAQIGGFGTVVLLVIRKLLWPVIRYLGGWDT